MHLTPNRSASWRQTKWFVFVLGALSLSIATFWALQGAWIILPFAGAEVALLIVVAHRVCVKNYQQQIVYIGDEELVVEWGYAYPKKKWHFLRSDSHVFITRPTHSLSPAKLELSDGNQTLPLGEFLNKNDTDKLIQVVQQQGINHRYRGHTKTVALDVFNED